MRSGLRLELAVKAAEKDSVWKHRPAHEQEKDGGLAGPKGYWKDLTREQRAMYSPKPAGEIPGGSSVAETEAAVDEMLADMEDVAAMEAMLGEPS